MGDRSGSGKDGMLCEIHPADKPQIAKSGGKGEATDSGRGGQAKKAKKDIGVREIRCTSNSHPVMSV